MPKKRNNAIQFCIWATNCPTIFSAILLQMTIYIRFQRARWVGMMVLLATAGLGSLIGQTITQSESGLTSSQGEAVCSSTTSPAGRDITRWRSLRLLPVHAFLRMWPWERARPWDGLSPESAAAHPSPTRPLLSDGCVLPTPRRSIIRFPSSRRVRSRPGGVWTFPRFGTLSTTEQLLFTPSFSGQLAAAPVDFEELAAGMLRNQFTNPQLAALLTGAPLLDAVVRPAIFGDRVFGASAQVRLSYAPSSRTSFYVGLGGSRNQVLPNSDREGNRPAGILNQSTSADVSVGLNHALTLRTTVGVTVSRSRTFSVFQDAYRDSFYGSVGRKMGRRWLVQGYGGAGRVQPIRSLYTLPTGPQYLAGASVAYKLSTHTFIASVDRNFGDSYGLGGQSTVSINGAWNWSPRGRDWALFSSIGQYRMLGSPLGNLNSWRASTGLSRKISTRAALSTEYAYATSSSPFGLIPNFSQHAARVAVTWSPQWSPLR